MSGRGLVALGVAALAAVVLAGAAVAAGRHPSVQSRIEHAARAYVGPGTRLGVVRVRLAAADPEYAAVDLVALVAPGSLDPATAVLHRELGAWHVLTLGTAELGCDIPSAALREQLDAGCDEG